AAERAGVRIGGLIVLSSTDFAYRGLNLKTPACRFRMTLAIHPFLGDADRLLRPQPVDGVAPRLRVVVPCIVLAGFVYGAVMGSYGGPDGPRPIQMLYSGL